MLPSDSLTNNEDGGNDNNKYQQLSYINYVVINVKVCVEASKIIRDNMMPGREQTSSSITYIGSLYMRE